MIARARLVPVLLALTVVWLGAGPPAVAQRAPGTGCGGDRGPVLPAGRQRRHRRSCTTTSGTATRSARGGSPDGPGLDIRATQDLSRFDLDFLLPVRSVTVDGQRRRLPLPPATASCRIRPATPVVERRRVPRRREVRRRTRGPRPRRGERNWLANDAEVVIMNEPHMAAWWFPGNDHPSDKATFDIRITAPRGRVVTNGVLVSDGSDKAARRALAAVDPMATYLAFFAAGDFDKRRGAPRHQPTTSRSQAAAGARPR